jgi:hypothetical protein
LGGSDRFALLSGREVAQCRRIDGYYEALKTKRKRLAFLKVLPKLLTPYIAEKRE